MLGRRRKPPLVPLADAVREVAACPCAAHQDSLAASLAAAEELVLRVMGDPADDAVDVTADEVQVATAIAPNGRTFLHAFTDVEAAEVKYPGGSFVGVATQTALRMSLSNGNEGLLVTAAGPDDPWAAVTADGVVRLLTTR